MASSLLRLVYQVRPTRSAAGMIISRTLYSQFSPNSSCSGSSPPKMSPWLMLPPVPEAGGGGIVYKFYSLAEEKVQSMKSESGSAAEFVGSSHGWIASFDRRYNSISISNPLTHRHIDLPSLYELPDIDMNTRIGRRNVSKVGLSSSSPDEDPGCRALMTFGPANRLAFCSPAQCGDDREHRWTPIGALFSFRDMKDKELECRVECAEVHEDLVYRARRGVFSTMTPCEFELDSFRYSDTRLSATCVVQDFDPWSPTEDWEGDGRGVIIVNIKGEHNTSTRTRDWVKENKALLQDQCVQIPHIVYAEESDELYIALRFVLLINPDDGKPVDRVPFCPYRGLGGYFPSKTVGFVVFKVGDDNMEIVDDLDGLAMFVGINHSFVLPASDFPELKPDSIYFTDSKRIERIYGRDDIGIFDYRNKTVAEVVSSDEIFDSDDAAPNPNPNPNPPGMGIVKPSPMWFTPCARVRDF